MMAITGDPSADGLVMERIEFSLGPLAGPLPGGLVGDLVLDGDVVADCRLRATLRRSVVRTTSAPEPPDMLAPRAWVAAIAGATEAENGVPVDAATAWLRIASVELERAVSHAAWVRVLGRLLSWPVLVERATTAIGPLLTALDHLPIHGSLSVTEAPCLGAVETGLRCAATEMSRLHALCVTSRRLASRMSGRGVLSPSAIRTLGLRGPIARASGVSLDSRGDDPRYRELGFEAVAWEGGDAHARALLRLDEATSAIALASAALRRAHTRASATEAVRPGGVGSVVEGPRGPLHAQRVAGAWRLTTPGAGPALAAAGDAAVGSEWASALVILMSFDLSPWMVGP